MSACIKCRTANSRCPHDGDETAIIPTPRNWRPPKKTNDRAWKLIEQGEVLWDRKAVARAAKRRAGASWAFWENYRNEKKEALRVLGYPPGTKMTGPMWAAYRLLKKEKK